MNTYNNQEFIDITPENPRWVRSKDGLVAGVCQGLGESFSIDVWLVRLALIASILFFGTGLLIYIILAFTLPRADKYQEAQDRILLGVCGRITRRTGTEIGLVRSLCVGLGFLSLGATAVGYIVLYFLMPDSRYQPIPAKVHQNPNHRRNY